jgi:dinuclear metal center YbgI/SA1388 family protein
MQTLNAVLEALQKIAPLELAESWDNVGLLVGDPNASISRVLTCLTLTEEVLHEAIALQVELIVPHHPIPFRPISRITTDDPTGRILFRAMQHSIAIYSPHTAWDNAPQGINRQLADALYLGNLRPINLANDPALARRELGSGILGDFATPTSIDSLIERLGNKISGMSVRHTDNKSRLVQKVGIVCGSGGSLLARAAQCDCDLFLTGEATYHQCLEAESRGIALLMIGHFASEAFAMKRLATLLASELKGIEATSSQSEYSSF